MNKEKYGINNLKIAVLAVCQLQLLIQSLLSNEEKRWVSFVLKIVGVIIKNFKTFKNFDYKLVDDEFKDLSLSETRELVNYVSKQIKINNEEKVLDFIESAINTANKGFKLFG